MNLFSERRLDFQVQSHIGTCTLHTRRYWNCWFSAWLYLAAVKIYLLKWLSIDVRVFCFNISYEGISEIHLKQHINLQHIFLYIFCIPAPNTLICNPVCRYCRKSKTYSYRADIARFNRCSHIIFRLLITTWSFCSSIISFPPLVTRPYS